MWTESFKRSFGCWIIYNSFGELHQFKVFFRLFYIFYVSFSTDYGIVCDRQLWIHKYLPGHRCVYWTFIEWNWNTSYDLKYILYHLHVWIQMRVVWCFHTSACIYLLSPPICICTTVALICRRMPNFSAQASVILYRDKYVKLCLPLYLQKHKHT
jgi:hypothetical protein